MAATVGRLYYLYYFRGKWDSADRFCGLGQLSSTEFCSDIYLAIPISPSDVLNLRKRIKIFKDI